jgi:hypothetical protein
MSLAVKEKYAALAKTRLFSDHDPVRSCTST